MLVKGALWEWNSHDEYELRNYTKPVRTENKAHRKHHNEIDSVSDHLPHEWLLNLLFRRRKYRRKHQCSESLAFVRGIHRSPVNSPQKGSVTRKMFTCDDVIMSVGAKIFNICDICYGPTSAAFDEHFGAELPCYKRVRWHLVSAISQAIHGSHKGRAQTIYGSKRVAGLIHRCPVRCLPSCWVQCCVLKTASYVFMALTTLWEQHIIFNTPTVYLSSFPQLRNFISGNAIILKYYGCHKSISVVFFCSWVSKHEAVVYVCKNMYLFSVFFSSWLCCTVISLAYCVCKLLSNIYISPCLHFHYIDIHWLLWSTDNSIKPTPVFIICCLMYVRILGFQIDSNQLQFC